MSLTLAEPGGHQCVVLGLEGLHLHIIVLGLPMCHFFLRDQVLVPGEIFMVPVCCYNNCVGVAVLELAVSKVGTGCVSRWLISSSSSVSPVLEC